MNCLLTIPGRSNAKLPAGQADMTASCASASQRGCCTDVRRGDSCYYIYIYIHIHTYIHICICTHMYVYIYIYIFVYLFIYIVCVSVKCLGSAPLSRVLLDAPWNYKTTLTATYKAMGLKQRSGRVLPKPQASPSPTLNPKP